MALTLPFACAGSLQALLSYIDKEERGAANDNAIAVHEQIRIIDLRRVDDHAISACQVANREAAGTVEYLGMFARSFDIGQRHITRPVSPKWKYACSCQ